MMVIINGLSMALESCTPTNPKHHQQTGGLSGAGKGKQGVKVMG